MVSEKTEQFINGIESALHDDFKAIDEISLFNQKKVLKAFADNKIALRHFASTTGYGYGDEGREMLGKVYADVFKSQSAIVSPHILSGTHAISLVLFSLLRRGDTMLSITGAPYDTLKGIISGQWGSLGDYGVNYAQSDLRGGEPDKEAIKDLIIKHKPKMAYLQRSRGYAARNPVSISQIKDICKFIKDIDENIIIFADNCYGEFTEKQEPTEVGVDIIAGSLIKNAGGGLAPNGGYIAGTEELIDKVYARFTTPSTRGEIGSYSGGYQYYYQGLFMAPHVTAQAIKGSCLIGAAMKAAGYKVIPEKRGDCYDMICSVEFNSEEELIAFCRAIQQASPIDSHVAPYPWDMPGYNDKVIMAAGCFVQGSSIELSCDAPIRKPYIAYVQGGLTYEHVKIASAYCLEALNK